MSKTYDNDLLMKDAGLVASSAAATVGGVAKVLDAGAGLLDADLVIDVSAIEIASNDEKYSISIQGSNSATFASGIEQLATKILGANEAVEGDADSAIGRYVLAFRNERLGTKYRYLRVYTTVAGSIATGGGINFTAYIAKKG